MVAPRKKLGVLLAAGPDHPNFEHGLKLAEAALSAGNDVYLYCIDQAVSGIHQAPLQNLKQKGVKLFACAYSARRHEIPVDPSAVFGGLSMLHDLISSTDRFVCIH